MSDFDREAERKRLEEKYEKDREKRKSTQRMSELLLKGATMTNQHCDECGSPIFRYDGQEFCPNCRGDGESAAADAGDAPVSADPSAGAEAGAETNAGGDAGEAAGTPPDSDPERVRDVGPKTDAPGAPDASDAEVTETETRGADAAVGAPETETAVDAADPSAADAPERTAGTGAPNVEGNERGRRESPAGASAGGGSDAGRSSAGDDAGARATTGTETAGGARESLLRALRTHADRAADAEDPRQAREHLEAAHEAAEALSALDR